MKDAEEDPGLVLEWVQGKAEVLNQEDVMLKSAWSLKQRLHRGIVCKSTKFFIVAINCSWNGT